MTGAGKSYGSVSLTLWPTDVIHREVLEVLREAKVLARTSLSPR